ncbi:MAG: Delta-1-pyrroline-5-carboxylate dehydrogenase [Parcubacteria group bacterium GW2011_GWB1_45_9]|nr:MAG: Delta-1-pyrroline-5-carboxylate dehydrogenase [Parcubacteria group bacterium GW2011_GWB1_45_9]
MLTAASLKQARKGNAMLETIIEDKNLLQKLIGFGTSAAYLSDKKEIEKLWREKIDSANLQFPKRLIRHIPAAALIFGLNFFARKFISGNGLKKTLKTIERCRRKGFSVNLDILGETVLSEKDAERYRDAYVSLIKDIGPRLLHGELSISLKCSALYSQANPCAPEFSAKKIAERAALIFEALAYFGGHAYLDAEEYHFKEIYFEVFKRLYCEYGSSVRTVIQSYLKTADDTLYRLTRINKTADPIWIRLVRGAYWDFECFLAEKHGWSEPPVFKEKADTDYNYRYLFRKGLELGFVMVAATHNAESLESFAGLSRETQMLYGLGEKLGATIIRRKIPVRIYMPILYPAGNLTDGIAYLLRRVSETQSSFILKTLKEA